MPKLTPQQLKTKYQSLPQDLRDAILSVDSAEIIQDVGKKYGLAIDKVGELADETGMVMLGVTHPKEFIPNLSRRLGVDKNTARRIAEVINSRIFAKVRESLKKVHEIGETKAAAPTSSAPSAMVAPYAPRSSSPPPSPPSETFSAPIPPKSKTEGDKEEILKEIEKDETSPETEGKVSDSAPAPAPASPPKNPFEAKMAGGALRMPPEESRHKEEEKPKPERGYPDEDPYREPIE